MNAKVCDIVNQYIVASLARKKRGEAEAVVQLSLAFDTNTGITIMLKYKQNFGDESFSIPHQF